MATITFRCSSCQQMLKVSADKAGKKVRCAKCGTILPIPASDAADQVKAAPATPPPVAQDDIDETEPVRRRKNEDDDDEPRRRRPPVEDDEDIEDRPRRKPRPVEDDEYEDDRRRRRGRYEDDEAPARQRRPSAPPSGVVTGIGLLNLLFAAVIIVASIALMIAGPTFIYQLTGMAENAMAQHPFPPNDPNAQLAIQQGKEAMRMGAGIASFMFILIGSCSIVLGGVPLVLAGIGVLKRQQWGRVLTLILGGLSLLNAIWIVYQFWPFNWFGWTWVLVHIAYGLVAFVFLLMSRFAEEFA